MRILHFGFLVGFFTVLGLCGVLLLDLFKLSYLPWRDARSQGAAGEQRQKSLTTGPLTVLNELHPSVMACLNAQIQCDRRVAALRTVEALRLHAASHDGKLPTLWDRSPKCPYPTTPRRESRSNTTAPGKPRCSWPLTPD
ncbi:MAG: hypothetical protein ACXVCF_05995 [Isosphaeraceae bacterium]